MKKERTKKEVENYVKSKKNDYVGTFNRFGKEWIYFQDKSTNYFTGMIQKTKSSESVVKRYVGTKFKVKVNFVGERKKRTFNYKVYNRKQQKELLYRINKKNRTPDNNRKFKRYVEKLTRFKNDAIPITKDKKKNKIDLLFDKIIWQEVKIQEFVAKS